MQSPEKNFECLESWGTQFCSTAIQMSPCYPGTSPTSHRPIDDWAFPPNCAPTFTHFIITSWFLPSLFLLCKPLIVPPSPYSPKSITPCLPTLWLSQDPPTYLTLPSPTTQKPKFEYRTWTVGGQPKLHNRCLGTLLQTSNRFRLNQL